MDKPVEQSVRANAVKPLARTFLYRTMTLYLLVALALSAIYLLYEYHREKLAIRLELESIAQTIREGLTRSIWDLNYYQVQLELLGISRLPLVSGTAVWDHDGQLLAEYGAPQNGSTALLTSPSPKPPITVPASWPTPPSTTAMNESMM